MNLRKVQELMIANRVVINNHQYTRPAPLRYPQQWLWDSCFHAIILSHFDTESAKKELLSLLAHQIKTGHDQGMLPHMIYWDGGGRKLWKSKYHSRITQPPLIAIAAISLWKKTKDKDFLKQIFSPLVDYHSWMSTKRVMPESKLAYIIHPWESGCDSSPRWDSFLPINKEAEELDRSLARSAMVKDLNNNNYQLTNIAEIGNFCAKPVDFNSIRVVDLESLAEIAEILGEDEAATKLKKQAEDVKNDLHDEMWNEEDKFYYDLAGEDSQPIKVKSASSFISLFAKIPGEPEANKLIEILKRDGYWFDMGISSHSANCSEFEGDTYWRGNVWPPVNWLIWQGLIKYGYHEDAEQLARNFINLVDQQGFYEYFNPITGQGHGPSQQSWTAIAYDMFKYYN